MHTAFFFFFLGGGVDEGLHTMQSVASTCYHGKSAGFWQCLFFLVKSRFTSVAWPGRRGIGIPGNCPPWAACIPKDQMAVSDEGQEWSVTAIPFREREFSNLWFTASTMHGKSGWPLKDRRQRWALGYACYDMTRTELSSLHAARPLVFSETLLQFTVWESS